MYKINSESIGNVKKYVWHYRKDNKEYGPFTYEDIIEMVKKGEIGPDDYVLKFGNKKFIKVSEVQGLFDVIKQIEENNKGQMEVSEEQAEVKKESIKEEYHAAFDSRAKYIQSKRRKEAFNQKIAMFIAGLLGLCLAVWLLVQLL